MADRAVYRKLDSLKRQVAESEKARQDWQTQLDGANEGMKADPSTRAMFEDLVPEITEQIKNFDDTLARLRDDIVNWEAKLSKKHEVDTPKFDPEKHPLLKKSAEANEPAKPAVINSGDVCEAQWTDRQWYKVKVLGVFGSTSAPQYKVRFVDYQDSTLTVDRDAIRIPYNDPKKRKTENVVTSSVPTANINSRHVISGPASVNPSAVPANKEASEETGGGGKRRKISNNKTLQKHTTNWKGFLSSDKGGKAVAKKESQFRVGASHKSKVGVTGSGAGMTATAKRVRLSKNSKEKSNLESEDAQAESTANGTAKFRDQSDNWRSSTARY